MFAMAKFRSSTLALDQGLTNGNPVQALLEDGLDGRRISQVGLAPFANTHRAHEKAKAAGISVRTARECRAQGLAVIVAQELERLKALGGNTWDAALARASLPSSLRSPS